MTARSLAYCLLICFASAAGLAPWAAAQQKVPLPSQRYSSLRALDTVPMEQLPEVDGEALRAEDAKERDDIGPYRYGTVVEADVTPAQEGTWERLPSGDWLWRFRVQSTDARSLSIGFSPFSLPRGARLFVHDGAGNTIRGPYTAADATNGQHRTPLVRGEEIVVELVVPDGRRSAVDLVLDKVVHGYRPIRPTEQKTAPSKSGSCNLDVACEEADPWRDQVRSVGLYTFEENGNAFLCTGSLMNNTAEDERPFFLTAEHCVSSPIEASTMVFYWNYQNETCRTPGTDANGDITGDNKLDQTSSGAVLRARYGSVHEDGAISGKSDLALVEVDDRIPSGYDLFFNGWSRAGEATGEAVTIHHPSGHGKRISFDRDSSTVTPYGETSGGDTHLRIGNWETGTTEPGSSGSPLYDTDHRVVGVLSGGLAGCVSGTAEDNDEPDWYGRIAPGFSNGDYTPDGFQTPATLSDWLDPLDSGAVVLDGLSQSGVPRPDPPTDLTATATADSVTLNWTASDSADVVQYRIYRALVPIDSTAVPPDTTVYDTVSAEQTRYTDTSVAVNTRYYYRLTAADSGGVESAVSGRASDFVYPAQVHASVERSFGDVGNSTDYRLVALPGKVNRPLADAIDGEAGRDWQAYWDDGSETDFLVKYDGSAAFTFKPGTGFWLTAIHPWTSSAQVETVDLRGDTAATIGLRDGWNIISNPTGKDVAWNRVEVATYDTLQALWGFDGAFTRADTFRSARNGVAYYFLNDSANRDTLVIPYPGAARGPAGSKAPSEKDPPLALTARRANAEEAAGSTVRMGIADSAPRGLGPGDLVAPPGRFAETNLRIEGPDEVASARGRFLMAERRPPAKTSGHTFALQLTSRSDSPITLAASHLEAMAGRRVALLYPSAGRTYDLREQSSVTVEPRSETTTLKVSVGTDGYVEDKVSDVLPTAVRLTSYPNPMREQGTIEYALPERTTVTLRVYDVLGREVATLARGPKEAGRHTVQLETSRLSNGVYIGRLMTGNQTRTLKITVVR